MGHSLHRHCWLKLLIGFTCIASTASNASAELTDGLCNNKTAQPGQRIERGMVRAAEQNIAERRGILIGALQYNPYLRSAEIIAELKGVSGNMVVLSGYVNSPAARALAEQLSLSVNGVTKVQNRLIVDEGRFNNLGEQSNEQSEPRQRLSNVTITNKVKSQLLANRQTSGTNIEVVTNDRVVTIAGEVETSADRELAYWVVKNTQGVVEVVDRLDITPPLVRQASIQSVEPIIE